MKGGGAGEVIAETAGESEYFSRRTGTHARDRKLAEITDAAADGRKAHADASPFFFAPEKSGRSLFKIFSCSCNGFAPTKT